MLRCLTGKDRAVWNARGLKNVELSKRGTLALDLQNVSQVAFPDLAILGGESCRKK